MFDTITLGSLPGVIFILLNRASQYVSRYWRWNKLLELEEYIKDGFDDSLRDYMYAKGMTTGDIESHMRELYDIDISDSTISRITDKILPIVKEWQERPLEEVYAVVFMDAIHYHVRSEGRIVKRAVYISLGIDMNGKKDVLSPKYAVYFSKEAMEELHPGHINKVDATAWNMKLRTALGAKFLYSSHSEYLTNFASLF